MHAQPAPCTPTQRVSADPDANGRYTTTITCADTAAEGAADYRHLHYNQGPGLITNTDPNQPDHPTNPDNRGTGLTTNPNTEDRDPSLPNNDPDNNVMLTIGRGIVFTADGTVDMSILPFDAAIALWRGSAKTVIIEDGAVINLERTPDSNSWDDALINLAGIFVESESNAGDITVRHDGVINTKIDIRGRWANFWSDPGSAGYVITAVMSDGDTSKARASDDVLIEMGATGVIRHLAGNEGMGGISGQSYIEDGDVTITLAKGSLIDLSESGGALQPLKPPFVPAATTRGVRPELLPSMRPGPSATP